LKTTFYALLLLVLAQSASAQVTFRLLDTPRTGEPHDFSLSRDGESMGCLLNGSVYWWTEMEGFRFIDAGTTHPGGVGLSASGNALVANRRKDGQTVTTIWYLDGSSIDLDPILQACGSDPVETRGLGLSDDGTVAVICDSDCQTEQGFLWSTRSGTRPLAGVAPGSRAVTCSDDGTTAVGFSEDVQTGLHQPVLWRDGGTAEHFLGADSRGEALDVSANGQVVVGQARLTTLNPQGFYWRDGSATVLGSLSGRAAETSRACAVSDDGKVVGWSGDALWDNQEAFIWTENHGMRALAEVLADNDVNLPAGMTLTGALDISGDGRVLVGVGRDRNWNLRYWRLEMGPYATLQAGSSGPSPEEKGLNPDPLDIQHGQLLPGFPFGKRRIQQ